ncbi:hypothetical protein CQW23_01918 [Capsicum baccatum]|uniref:Uncharacterized protein n=1 Tax=Capsicum baccatum TaxID=33114 RepID=A0A2G2XPY7_CAPBA|nr:hypothetical protein CQW23_01918 [Capsicum baccatum]
MTAEYLLTPLMPKIVNLYGFPWAFMAWAFETIPYLRQQVDITATTEEHNMAVDNPSTASKDEENVEHVSLGERKNYLFEGDCGSFFAAYAGYLSNGLQVLNDGLDVGLLHKRYAALLWKYGEAKAQKSYTTDVKDPRVALDEEQLVHID